MLSGEVQECIDGVWRVVLTPTGIPVQDHRRLFEDHSMDALRYAMFASVVNSPDVVITKHGDGRITWKH